MFGSTTVRCLMSFVNSIRTRLTALRATQSRNVLGRFGYEPSCTSCVVAEQRSPVHCRPCPVNPGLPLAPPDFVTRHTKATRVCSPTPHVPMHLPHLSSSRVCATRKVEASRRVQKKQVYVCCCKSGSAKIQRVGLMCRGACLLLQCANKISKGVHEAHEGAEWRVMRFQIDPQRLKPRNDPG